MFSKRSAVYWNLFLLNFLLETCSSVSLTVDEEVTVIEGIQARITCNIVPATSGATPTITWYNGNNTDISNQIASYQIGFRSVTPGYDRFSVEGDTANACTLVVNNTLRNDSRLYNCHVSLPGDTPSSAEDTCKLTVAYLENVVFNLTTPVIEGDAVVVTCSADSSTEPTYTFTKDGDKLSHDGSSSYTIQSASRTDNGSYECEADNGAIKQKSESIYLDVRYIEIEINDEVILPGDTVTIPSTVTANPSEVTYLWTTDLPGNDDAVNNGSEYKLNISKLKDEDSFVVNLTATNSAGSKKDSAKITISVRNIIGSTTGSAKITILSRPTVTSSIRPTATSKKATTTTPESCNEPYNMTGLIIGMIFVGIFIGIVGFYIGQIIHNKIKKNSLSKKQDTDKKSQDTYMDYGGETAGQNQTYQDLQHRVEESAYVNVKTGNKNKKGKV